MLATVVAGQAMGVWSDHNHDAYRIFLPLIATCALLREAGLDPLMPA